MSIKNFPKIVTKQFTLSAVLIVVLPLKLIHQGELTMIIYPSFSDLTVHLPDLMDSVRFPMKRPWLYTFANSLLAINNDCKRFPF
jgi:hypothetical protein